LVSQARFSSGELIVYEVLLAIVFNERAILIATHGALVVCGLVTPALVSLLPELVVPGKNLGFGHAGKYYRNVLVLEEEASLSALEINV